MTMVLSNYFIRVSSFVLTILLLIAPMASRAEVIFEGYYKLLSANMHAGFIVQRFETDPKKKTITCTYYVKSNAVGNDVTESLKAVSTTEFKPISYQYTSKTKDGLKAIDAKFTDTEMKLTVSDGKTSKALTKKIPDKVFLSSFVGYLMLNNGISKGKNFAYQAIAEEDGEVASGKAKITDSAKVNGLDVFRIENTFKNVSFISFVSDKAEVISTKSPALHLSTELVKTSEEATKGMTLPIKDLKVLFGSLPTGKKNVLVEKEAKTK